MTETEWNADHVKYLGVRLAGDAIGEVDDAGNAIVGDTLLYLLNAGATALPFTLPAFVADPCWENVLDTLDDRRVRRELRRHGNRLSRCRHLSGAFQRRSGQDRPDDFEHDHGCQNHCRYRFRKLRKLLADLNRQPDRERR